MAQNTEIVLMFCTKVKIDKEMGKFIRNKFIKNRENSQILQDHWHPNIVPF